VTDRLPSNLAQLYQAFGKDAIDQILPGDTFTIEDVEFVCKYSPESSSRRFFIVKPMALVERYRSLCESEWQHANIVELGIAEGGSTALLALLADPKKLVALDIETTELPALRDFIDERSLGERIRPYYGVDQADGSRLDEIADHEFGDDPLDLVIDDASHVYSLTRASFETLFPRLRPGGTYVIEDWSAAHTMRDAVREMMRDLPAERRAEFAEQMRRALSAPDGLKPETPLSRLAVELLVCRASLGDVIDSVSVDRYWLKVRRGPGEIAAGGFRLDDICHDYFGYLSGTQPGDA
jgi:predicted O-methyltransferase YrrM